MLSKVPVAGQMCTTSQQKKKDVFIFIRAVEKKKKTTIIEAEKLVSFTHTFPHGYECLQTSNQFFKRTTMDNSYDDLLAISTLVLSLSQNVSDSEEYITKLQSLSKNLVSKDQFEQLSKEADVLTESNNNANDNDEMSIIRKLEEERLSLIMDIQREDFVSSKLIELIDQNQEIIESVKEYLEARESIQEEEAAYTKKQLDIFVNDIVLPILAQLNENLTGLLARMKNVARKLLRIQLRAKENPDLAMSENYRKEFTELVQCFCSLCKEYKTT